MGERIHITNSLIAAVLQELRGDEKWEAAIIVQGVRVDHTPTAIRQLVERNDSRTLIIVSTYLPPAEEHGDACLGSSLSPHERQFLSDRRIIYIYIRVPDREEFPDFWRSNCGNQNLQRLSSFVGLRHAYSLGIEWAMKCRADSLFGVRNICFNLITQCLSTPVRPRAGTALDPSKLRNRIIFNDYFILLPKSLGPYYTGKFHGSDLWLFGRTTDLIHFFDMRKGSAWDEGRGMLYCQSPEDNLWEMWLREIGVKDETSDVEEAFGRFAILGNSADVEMSS